MLNIEFNPTQNFPLPALVLLSNPIPKMRNTPKYLCGIEKCGEKFTTKHSLKRHQFKKHGHNVNSDNSCTYCNKPFYNLSEKKRHEKTHTKNTPSYCSSTTVDVARPISTESSISISFAPVAGQFSSAILPSAPENLREEQKNLPSNNLEVPQNIHNQNFNSPFQLPVRPQVTSNLQIRSGILSNDAINQNDRFHCSFPQYNKSYSRKSSFIRYGEKHREKKLCCGFPSCDKECHESLDSHRHILKPHNHRNIYKDITQRKRKSNPIHQEVIDQTNKKTNVQGNSNTDNHITQTESALLIETLQSGLTSTTTSEEIKNLSTDPILDYRTPELPVIPVLNPVPQGFLKNFSSNQPVSEMTAPLPNLNWESKTEISIAAEASQSSTDSPSIIQEERISYPTAPELFHPILIDQWRKYIGLIIKALSEIQDKDKINDEIAMAAVLEGTRTGIFPCISIKIAENPYSFHLPTLQNREFKDSKNNSQTYFAVTNSFTAPKKSEDLALQSRESIHAEGSSASAKLDGADEMSTLEHVPQVELAKKLQQLACSNGGWALVSLSFSRILLLSTLLEAPKTDCSKMMGRMICAYVVTSQFYASRLGFLGSFVVKESALITFMDPLGIKSPAKSVSCRLEDIISTIENGRDNNHPDIFDRYITLRVLNSHRQMEGKKPQIQNSSLNQTSIFRGMGSSP